MYEFTKIPHCGHPTLNYRSEKPTRKKYFHHLPDHGQITGTRDQLVKDDPPSLNPLHWTLKTILQVRIVHDFFNKELQFFSNTFYRI